MRYRKERMQDLLREEISTIIQQDIKDPGLGFITVVEIRMTADLKHAKVYYTVYGTDEEKEKTAVALKRARNYVKHLIGERIRLKYVPDLTFVFDTDQERAARIDEILKKVSHVSEDQRDTE